MFGLLCLAIRMSGLRVHGLDEGLVPEVIDVKGSLGNVTVP